MNLADQYAEMHRDGHFKGTSVLEYAKDIKGAVADCATLLDYGCGKGEQYTKHRLHEIWDVKVTPYDIGVPEYSKKPEAIHDAVICTDMLEHLEREDIAAVLDEIFSYARKMVFLSICTRLAKKTLPDGRNCHLTVENKDWWRNKIGSRQIPYIIKWTQ